MVLLFFKFVSFFIFMVEFCVISVIEFPGDGLKITSCACAQEVKIKLKIIAVLGSGMLRLILEVVKGER